MEIKKEEVKLIIEIIEEYENILNNEYSDVLSVDEESILKSLKKQFILPVVVHTLKDCLIAQQPVEYKNKKHYLTTLEIMDSGEEICELMNTDTYEVISNVNGEEVKIF